TMNAGTGGYQKTSMRRGLPVLTIGLIWSSQGSPHVVTSHRPSSNATLDASRNAAARSTKETIKAALAYFTEPGAEAAAPVAACGVIPRDDELTTVSAGIAAYLVSRSRDAPVPDLEREEGPEPMKHVLTEARLIQPIQ